MKHLRALFVLSMCIFGAIVTAEHFKYPKTTIFICSVIWHIIIIKSIMQ